MHLPSEGSLFTAKPEPLADLLTGIHKHKIALPNFQRPWVWEPQMVYDLIVSVAYRYPAGSLLTMPVQSASFALRSFEGSGELRPGEDPGLMILDGQQRLTSLYQALFRPDGVHVKGRVYHFYLDVAVLMSDPDGSIDTGDPYFADALFYVAEEKRTRRRVRYEGLQPIYELTTSAQELEVGALPLRIVFDPNGSLAEWKKSYLVQQSDKDMDRFLKLDSEWDRLVRPWLDRIRNYPFPVVDLRADMPLGAICHIFEKVNSTGVPLDVFDLVTAILWAQGFHLNEEWASTRERLKRDIPMQPLSGTSFLQGLSLLDSLHRKWSHPDERIAVACRKQDLMALKRETVAKWWNVLVEGYREAAKFMKDNGILTERILPYSTLIVPLSTIFAHIKHHKGEAHVGSTWQKVEQWYWCSIFSQRYSSQVEYASAQDYEQVIGWINGGEPPDVVRTFGFRSDYLQEITSIRNAIYKGILCLLARNGARDFGGGGKLSTDLFYETSQDHHHIFPLNALKELKIDDPRVDAIVNKTLISAAVNRSIGGRRPSQYVGTWRGNLGGTTFDKILETHAINSNILSTDAWEEFVNDRRERLRQLIESACGGNVQPFTEEVEVEEPEEE
jgi:hypothetical protein